MRIAVAQLDLRIADLAATKAAILAAAASAVSLKADLLLTAELCALGGYPPRDLLERPEFVAAQWRLVRELAAALPLPALIGCAEPLDAGISPPLANALAFCQGGRVVTTYHKRLLPTYDVFDERRYFHPGGTRSEGPAIIDLQGKRIGLTICEDIWNQELVGLRYHEDPVSDLAGRCDVVVNASASPWQLGKEGLRARLVQTVALRLGAPLVYANQVGGHDELLFDGASCAASPDGSWHLAAPRWIPGVFIADLDGTVAPPESVHEHGSSPLGPLGDHALADLHAALVTGIRDYCGKTGQRRVVLGLSGGIDSALVAALAADALGPDAVTGLLMPGPYSSRGSVTDAIALAEALGIDHHVLAINRAFEVMLGELDPVFAGGGAGVAEENLQSRLRGTLVMAVANQRGAMALTTGNKSELAVGYCTIYGDMNGGLAPIGDLYKTQVWALSRWMNRAAGRERIPEASITKAPSAELRPDQTDQDSLPPYDQLDRILHRWLELGDSATAIAADEDAATVARVIRLVEVSEFKRRQAAPVLRVSGKAFGVGRRIPIARAF
jgi:NAD+ synthetase